MHRCALCLALALLVAASGCGGHRVHNQVAKARTTLNMLNHIDQEPSITCSDLFSNRLIHAQFKSLVACDQSLKMEQEMEASLSTNHKVALSSAEQRLMLAYKAARAAAVSTASGNYPTGKALWLALKQGEPRLGYILGSSSSARTVGLIAVPTDSSATSLTLYTCVADGKSVEALTAGATGSVSFASVPGSSCVRLVTPRSLGPPPVIEEVSKSGHDVVAFIRNINGMSERVTLIPEGGQMKIDRLSNVSSASMAPR